MSVPQQPSTAPPPRYRFPRVQRTTLAGGLTVEAIHMPGRHLATVVAVLDLPLTAEPRGMDGANMAMTFTLNEGVGELDAADFAARLGRVGATWKVGGAHDGSRIVVDVPTSRLGGALDLVAAALTHPNFPDDAVERYATRTATLTRQRDATPQGQASVEFLRAAIDSGHRASRPIEGDARSLKALDSEHLRSLHSAAVAPSRTTLLVVGDLAGIDVPMLVEAAFRGWDATPTPALRRIAPTRGDSPGLVMIETPGADQTQLILGSFSPDRQDPDWPALTVAARVLGQGPDSLINTSLREGSGYSYGLDTRLSPMRGGGTFAITGSVRADTTATAVSTLLATLRKVWADGFDSDRCLSARDHIVRAAPLTYETSGAVARHRAELIGQGLPDGYTDTYLDAVRTVSPADVTDAFTRKVAPKTLTLIVASDPTVCDERSLRAAIGEALPRDP